MDHNLLVLHKLEHYGICGQLILWLTDFLSERKQQAIAAEVTSGIPQGFVLEPLH